MVKALTQPVFRIETVALALLACLASGCPIPLTYYDTTTYEHLVDMKVDSADLVGSFGGEVSEAKRAEIVLVDRAMRKALAYEQGKGDDNQDTIDQFTKLAGLFNTAVADYVSPDEGDLGSAYFVEAAKQLSEAFDIAIETEALKNKQTE